MVVLTTLGAAQVSPFLGFWVESLSFIVIRDWGEDVSIVIM